MKRFWAALPILGAMTGCATCQQAPEMETAHSYYAPGFLYPVDEDGNPVETENLPARQEPDQDDGQ